MICHRCGGRLYEDSDLSGRFRSCLNCGHLEPLDHYDPEGKTQPNRTNRSGKWGGPRGRTWAQRHPRA